MIWQFKFKFIPFLLLLCNILTVFKLSKINAQSTTELPVESYIIEDVEEFNTQVLSELTNASSNSWYCDRYDLDKNLI
jgi:hypothetical protein